ncbi:MAG: phosphoribosyltransferase family protein [Chloroflexota bacterium]
MQHENAEALFENRFDAGRQLAEKLMPLKDKNAVVVAIPNGGVAVALPVALALNADLDLVISRKIPLPLSPEGGFGAVTDDGTLTLDDEVVQKFGLTPTQIEYQVNQVRAGIRQRSLLYHSGKRPVVVADKIAIIIDDGLAAGYTMTAAVNSVRKRRPRQVIVAVPVGPADTVRRVEKVADAVVTCAVGKESRFYVSDYYRFWHEISDQEVVQYLKEWRIRRYQSYLEPAENPENQGPG